MTRYAIYFMPAPDRALWAFGCSAIGYDAYTMRDVAFPDCAVFKHGDASAWTADPRRYGFHATLKAPFELMPGQTEANLLSAAEAFARAKRARHVERLVVAEIGAFLALVEPEPCPQLNALAAECVRAFEPFRAPLREADRARRLAFPMSARKRENLDRWGYHLVFEDFRFHMTLTGRLDDPTRAALLGELSRRYSLIETRPVAIDAIAVFRQPHRDARFEVLARFELRAAAS